MKYLLVIFLYLFLVTNLCAEKTPLTNEKEVGNTVQELQESLNALTESTRAQQQDLNSLKESSLIQQEALDSQKTQMFSFMEGTESRNDEISKGIESLSKVNARLSAKIKVLEKSISGLSGQFDNLEKSLNSQAEQISKQSALLTSFEGVLAASKVELAEKVNTVGQGVTETRAQLSTLDRNVGGQIKQLGYWVALVASIGIVGVVLGVAVRKRLTSSKNQLETNLTNMRLQMEEENVKLDSKLVELLQSQIKFTDASTGNKENAQSSGGDKSADHSLPVSIPRSNRGLYG